MPTLYPGNAAAIAAGAVPAITVVNSGEPRNAATVDAPIQTNTDWERYLLEAAVSAQVSAWRLQATDLSNERVKAFAYDPAIGFVAVGSNDVGGPPYSVLYRSLTAMDGDDFLPEVAANDASWNAAHGDSGLMVIVGGDPSNKDIESSTDGITWTSRVHAAGPNFRCVTKGGGLWVALGNTGLFYNSGDGLTWTSRASGTSKNLVRIAYGAAGFVAGTDDGHIFTSPDGTASSWVDRGVPAALGANFIYGLVYANGLYVACSNGNGKIATSTDGITWTARTLPTGWAGTSAGPVTALATDGRSFLAVVTQGGGGKTMLAGSVDGISWYRRPQTFLDPYGLGAGGGLYLCGMNERIGVSAGLIVP